MNLSSMTGFGSSRLTTAEFDINIDIKSINSKYFDLSLRLPKILSSYELVIRKAVQDKVVRGKVDIKIEVELHTTTKLPRFNEKLLEHYITMLNSIRDKASIKEPINLSHIIRLPELIEFTSDTSVEEGVQKATLSSIEVAVNNLLVMRHIEGEKLATDIANRLSNLEHLLKSVVDSKQDIFAIWLEKFKVRLSQLELENINEDRIVQEAVIYGEKADITEEIVRLTSHINQFKNIMNNEVEVGKKLDFLSVELVREFNTIASKSSNTSIINNVVEAKSEIDKIREQIQNLV